MFYGKGINKYNFDNNNGTIHAEVDAINHLKETTKRKKVNLFVFRTNNKADKLLMAKPCDNCMRYINTNIEKKGYRLKNIFYSDYDGNIVKLII